MLRKIFKLVHWHIPAQIAVQRDLNPTLPSSQNQFENLASLKKPRDTPALIQSLNHA